LPQVLRGPGTAREPAAYANDRDRLLTSLLHLAQTLPGLAQISRSKLEVIAELIFISHVSVPFSDWLTNGPCSQLSHAAPGRSPAKACLAGVNFTDLTDIIYQYRSDGYIREGRHLSSPLARNMVLVFSYHSPYQSLRGGG